MARARVLRRSKRAQPKPVDKLAYDHLLASDKIKKCRTKKQIKKKNEEYRKKIKSKKVGKNKKKK